MKFLSRLLTTALGATLLVSSAAHARTVVIGHVNLSFHEATAAVFQNVLERSGYNVAMKKGSHSVMYPLLAEGEFDLFVAAWLPGSEGQGVADVLFGDYDFQGRLSFSWPKVTAPEINLGDANYDPLFAYDYGLSYK